jgi:P27 family predicted phage terminase small subunit
MRRTPTASKILRGTFRKDRVNLDEPQPEPPNELEAPAWLDDYGRECWDAHVPQLVKISVLTSLDMFLFAAICERWSVYRRATDKLKPEFTHQTESNGECAKPQVAIAKTAFDSFRQGLAEFGCSPASRSKVKAVSPNDDDPFEKYRSSKMPPKGAGRFLG